MFAADMLAAILDLQHCMQMGHIQFIVRQDTQLEPKSTFLSKLIVKLWLFFVLFLFAAAILAAILNISISPRVPDWHQPDSV